MRHSNVAMTMKSTEMVMPQELTPAAQQSAAVRLLWGSVGLEDSLVFAKYLIPWWTR